MPLESCRDHLFCERPGSEPTIAVNPNNPKQVIAAFQPATVAYSIDGAQTFTAAELPPVAGWRGGGDVSVTFDNSGRAYLINREQAEKISSAPGERKPVAGASNANQAQRPRN